MTIKKEERWYHTQNDGPLFACMTVVFAHTCPACLSFCSFGRADVRSRQYNRRVFDRSLAQICCAARKDRHYQYPSTQLRRLSIL